MEQSARGCAHSFIYGVYRYEPLLDNDVLVCQALLQRDITATRYYYCYCINRPLMCEELLGDTVAANGGYGHFCDLPVVKEIAQ